MGDCRAKTLDAILCCYTLILFVVFVKAQNGEKPYFLKKLSTGKAKKHFICCGPACLFMFGMYGAGSAGRNAMPVGIPDVLVFQPVTTDHSFSGMRTNKMPLRHSMER